MSGRALRWAAGGALALTLGCAHLRTGPQHETVNLIVRDPAGAPQGLDTVVATSAYTVLIFYSTGCNVLETHVPRLRAMTKQFAGRSVRFVAIASESGPPPSQIQTSSFPMPIWLDADSSIARTLGAEYASHVVVLDSSGIVQYRGGIDSDRARLTEDARHYLRDALSELLAGRLAPQRETKALGCILRLH